METNKILSADILDIIFEGKNKEYGAYQLRKTYNKRLVTALVVMATVCILAFLFSVLNSGDKDKNQIIVQDVQLEDVKQQEEKKPEPPPPPPPPKQEPPKVEITKFTPPQIVKDVEVREEDEIKEVEQLEDTKIGTINVEGKKDEGFVAPPVEEKGTGVVEAPKKVEEDYDKVFTKVEKEAKFPGGQKAWRKYLERNLNANVAADDGAPTGNYTVRVQFIVDKEGNISNVSAIEVPKACPSCGPEAVKVIKRGPKWDPAVQNGRNVIYQAVQHITFQVAEE
jgi:periplasmic protein TonB